MELFHKILVVIDSSRTEHKELQRAMKLADQTNAHLHLIDIVRDVGLTIRLLSSEYEHIHALLVREKQEEITSLLERCRAHGISATGEILEGPSSQRTIEAAHHFGADLVIRAAKGTGSLESSYLGSSAQKLLRRLPCAVWLTAAECEPQIERIVAAVDATPHDESHRRLNRRILEVAIGLANQERCKLLVCYVWNLYGSEQLQHRLPQSEYELLMEQNRREHMQSFEELLAEFDLHATGPQARLIEGEPSTAIPQLCNDEQCSLLICGSVSRHGIAGLMLGNTAERICNRVACSQLVLTPPEAGS